MSNFTPRANLRLPGGGSTGTILPDEQVDIDVLNDNFRKIDALLGARNIPSASSYSGSMDGDLVYARDTEFLHMFSANAGGLITPRLPGSKMFSGTRAKRVAFTGARDGDMWRDSDNIGIIWAYKAGSPGTWVYSGNKCRGTKADILQTDTDGIAVPGMTALCTDDNSEYVRGAVAWKLAGPLLFSAYKTGTFNVTSVSTDNQPLGSGLENSYTAALPAAQKLRVEWGAEIGAVTSISFGLALSGTISQPSVRGGQREMYITQQGSFNAAWVIDATAGSLTLTLVAGAVGAGGSRNILGSRLAVYAL